MPSKKVIVTGGAGFIGSNLAEELSKQHSVTVIDDLSTGRPENIDHIKNIEFIKGSITDPGLLKHAFRDAESVFHLGLGCGYYSSKERAGLRAGL